MRWLPRAIPILIGIIALDFALVFGLEAVRILASPIAGLEQQAFARMVYGLGRIGGLGPDGLVKLGGLFGGIYLTIAVMCALYLVSRIDALFGGRAAHDLFDATLILIVISTLVAATPAMLQGETQFLMLQRLPLWLVALTAILSMVERIHERDETRPVSLFERWIVRMLTRRAQEKPTYVAPSSRRTACNARWSELRNHAGMKVRSDFKPNGTPFVLR